MSGEKSMNIQRPEGGRVEDDFMQSLTPIKSHSPKRLAASLPMAIGAILLLGAVAFGANAIAPIIVPDESPIVVGDEPTPEPTLEPTAEPTEPVAPTPEPTAEPTAEPSAVALQLTATLSGSKVVLTWTAYEGDDFAYYKVVRSSDAEASWPLGEGDKLVAAIGDQGKLTFTDAPPTGATWSYQVFAVKCSEDGYQVIAVSNLVTVTVPKATPKPVPNCNMSLSATLIAPTAVDGGVALTVQPGYSVKLKWTKYTCDMFEAYVIIRSETNSKLSGVVNEEGQNGISVLGEKTEIGATSWVDSGLKPGHTYYFRVYAVNFSQACYGGVMLGQSNIVKVTIPAAAPTPEPPAE
jgi:hypothetical protein